MRPHLRPTRTSAIPVLCGLLLTPPVLTPPAAFGQESVRRLSLDEALEAFAENSLALKIARSENAALAGAARQSRAYFNPAFSFGHDDLGRDSDRFREETYHLLQQLEWPARTAARGRAAAYAIDAGAARLRADSVELAFEVREAYALAWLAEEAESIMRRAASVIRSAAENAEIRFEAGDLSAYDALRLRIERDQADLEVEEAARRARDARRTLAALIAAGTGTEEIGPSEALEGVPPSITREAAAAAIEQRPDVEAAASELDAARAGVEMAETYWVPDPTLGLGYRRQTDGFGGASIAVDLPLPLLDRGAGTRAEAAARGSAAAYRLDLTRRMAEYDLRSAADRHASSRARLVASAENLIADGRELLTIARAAYADGEMTLLDLLDAAGTFRSAELSVLSLTSEAWIAYYDLLRATGGAPDRPGG